MSQLIEINQTKVEMLKRGNSGKPIFILTGMGCSFYEWYDVIDSLSKLNQVITFHRPGLGKSERGTAVRNADSVVSELSEMIRLLRVTEPVVLIGHSYGGLCAQYFTKRHPEKVAGLILVDSTSVDLKELDLLDLPVLDKNDTDEIWLEKCQSYSQKKEEELSDIINPVLTNNQEQLPIDIQQQLLDFQIKPNLYKAMLSEIDNWKVDAEIIKNKGDFPEVPLIVIGRDREHSIQMGILEGLPEWELRIFEGKWQELIMKQANLTQNSELLFANESGHSIHMDRPDLIIKAIERILNQINC
ncbi:alpha/beta fold hydrolase [Cytobacillus purgationiresistens]|uniref:Pimeloyl-ACP methyl ester carboxylesterase n=1 Tax=Cytobacillus purgationiresistens TaxID=863449 RepID=A0ABU0AA96_9BACI|nr:alpha/beta hydrolase [Cytobacillus purgationiresistens]MDQ0268164.1 pimeloyl-ACP methyl ester carboxylesterase [Cytobacillus purgationiresistens]